MKKKRPKKVFLILEQFFFNTWIVKKIADLFNNYFYNNPDAEKKLGLFLARLKQTKKDFKQALNDRLVWKITLLIVMAIFITGRSFSWFYNEYISSGALLNLGSIEHTVIQYDSAGQFIEESGPTGTIIYESNMGNTTQNTKFIEITNDGTLDMEYNITFQLDGTTANAGVLYYRLFEVTTDVNNSVLREGFDTKLEVYANDNPIPSNIETDTVHPIANLSTIGTYVKNGVINVQGTPDPNPRYYRLDYGMYSAINSSQYSGEAVSVHATVYSTQVGRLGGGTGSGTIFSVTTESEFRAAVNEALSGDTIRLTDDLTIAGTINISKRVNIDTNEFTLDVTGDLNYDYVEAGELLIDTTGTGRIEVYNDFYINAPLSEIHFVGSNDTYDIYVGGLMTLNGLQNGEDDGILLEQVMMVKNTSTLLPLDLYLMSNTRLTIAPEVAVGLVKAVDGATNIEIINNGTITQVQLQDMNLLPTFTKAQIYVYNLGTIYGVLGSSSILLPATATPYLGPTQGNTLIIRGINSSDITVSGSDYFDQEDIQQNTGDAAVIPIFGEDDSYYVYIGELGVGVEDLLTNYFTGLNYPDVPGKIAAIKKLIISTINGQYMINDDFDFLKSSSVPVLEYLSIENARVRDGETINRIKSSALANKTSLKTLILPKTVSVIGASAFAGISLGVIPASALDPFNFVVIPASVTSIEEYAFSSAKYVKFEGLTPPTITSTTFNNVLSGTKYFVPAGSISSYQNLTSIYDENVFQNAYLSDNRLYFVFDNAGGVGISLIVSTSSVGTTLGVPNELTIDSYDLPVTAIGTSAYRHVTTDPAGATLTLPSTVTRIDYGAFYGLNITSANFANITTIGAYAFYDTSLTSITANALTTVGNYAFALSDISTANFNLLTTIGEGAFASVPNLYQVNLPVVRVIGNNAFYDCKNLSRVYFGTTDTIMVNNQEQIDISIGTNAIFSNWGYYIDGRLRVYVPAGSSGLGNSYLDIYKSKFGDGAQYTYVTGSSVGSYYHYAVPYDLTNYTVREVTLPTYLGVDITGWEIVSYQGADLTAAYSIPSNITVGSTTYPVISIGQSAFRNSVVTSGQVVDLTTTSIIKIGDYALYDLALHSITANNVVTLGNYALYSSNIETASFDNLNLIGNSALASISTLYSLDLGNVKTFGTNAIGDNPNLIQLYLNNTNMDLILNGNPLQNSTTNAGDKFRIYVADGDSYVNYYKTTFSSYANYVYRTGTTVGSYTHGTIPYNIGEYTVKSATLNNYSGTPVNGYEIIDYHGANLTSAYQIPATLTVASSELPVIALGREAYLNAEVTAGNELNLTNSNLISIGSKAFLNFDLLATITANGVTSIGANAFDGATLEEGTFDHLNSTGAYAFANMPNLYFLDLGTVKTMAANSLFNLDYLVKVLFDATDTSLSFASGSINDVGSVSVGKIRFYVTDSNSSGGTPFVDVYKVLFDASYQDYFYPMGYAVGSYTPTNIPYDIGLYTVRVVTVKDYQNNDVTGWEINEYHGDNLLDTYNLPANATANYLTYAIVSVGKKAYQHTAVASGDYVDLSSTNLLNIGQYAFYDLDGLNSITANNVVNIGESAFRYSTLVSASFNNLDEAKSYAFADIAQLNYINLGKIDTIGEGLLSNDTAIEQIFFSSTNASTSTMNISIGSNAFSSVGTQIGARLRVYVPDGTSGSNTYVTLYKNTLPSNINPYVYATGSLVESYTHSTLPYDIYKYMVKEVNIDGTNGWEIVDYHGPDINSSYTVPESFTINAVTKDVISIGENAYRFAAVESGHTWNLALPVDIINIGNYAFYQRAVTTVSGYNLYNIGSYAFADNTTLTTVTLDGVETIGTYAFYYNTVLNEVHVGVGVLSVGNYSFYNVTNSLLNFYILTETPPTIGTNSLPVKTNGYPDIYVPYDSYQAYNSATTWKNYDIIRVQTAYQGIYLYQFINTNEIEITDYLGSSTSITIPDYFTLDSVNYNVTSIASGTFNSAPNVRDITLPQYLDNVGNDLIETNTTIRNFYVHASNTHFSSNSGVLFDYSGTHLIRYPSRRTDTSYSLPSATVAIHYNAFKNATRLATINLNANLTTIAMGSFDGCTDLRTYNFAGTTPPKLLGFKTFPYYANMYLNVPTAALSTYQNNFAYYFYRNRIFGV